MNSIKLKHQLALTIAEARNIKTSNVLSPGSDAFMEMWISNRFPSKRTSVVKKTTSPVWNETFVVDVDDLDRDTLNLRLLGYQSMCDCSFLGQVVMQVKQLVSGPSETWIPLTDRNLKPNGFGEVLLKFQLFSPTSAATFGAAPPMSMMMPPVSSGGAMQAPVSGTMPNLSTSPSQYYMQPPMSGQPMYMPPPYMPMNQPYYGGMPVMMIDPATGMPVPGFMPMPMPMQMQMPLPGAPPQPPGMNSNGDITNGTGGGELYLPLYANPGPMPPYGYAEPYPVDAQYTQQQQQQQQQSSVPSPTASPVSMPATSPSAQVEKPQTPQYTPAPVPSLLD